MNIRQQMKFIVFYLKVIQQQHLILLFQQQLMFLNLKSKKVTDYVASIQTKNQSQINSSRQVNKDRQSRQSRQIKSTRPHHQNTNLKKPAITPIISNHNPTPNSYITINKNYKQLRQQSQQKQFIQQCHHSRQKIDSIRLANAYRKIKKYQTADNISAVQNIDREQDHIKKIQNKSQRIAYKKQMLKTIANNYICNTVADQYQYRKLDMTQTERNTHDHLSQILELFLDLFSWEVQAKEVASVPLRNRVQSSREGELNRSNERVHRNISKQTKKKSNQILIRDYEFTSSNESQSIHETVKKFIFRIEQTQCKIKHMEFQQKTKFIEHPFHKLMERMLNQIQTFFRTVYTKCLQQMDKSCQKYQSCLLDIIKEEKAKQIKYQQLQKMLIQEKQKNELLHNVFIDLKAKTLFGQTLIGQVSKHFNVDQFIRERFEEQLYGNESSYNLHKNIDEQGRSEIVSTNSQHPLQQKAKKKNNYNLFYGDHYNQFLDQDCNPNHYDSQSVKSNQF